MWCMRGFSGAGKSTRAREIADEHDAVVINRDYLRKMLLGEWWTGDKSKGKHKLDEDRVTVAEEAQVVALLLDGVNTIIDATHLNPQSLRKWAKLATRMGIDFEVVDVDPGPSVCLIRDAERAVAGDRAVGEKVIRDQLKRFPRHKWPTITAEPFVTEPADHAPCKPSAIIFDLDGTAAHNNAGRSPYDYTRVGEDDPDIFLRDALTVLYDFHVIIACSGRDDTCRADTEAWLSRWGFKYDALLMRDTTGDVDEKGNKLPDYQVKYRLFNDHIRGKYNVEAVFDDRQQVVDMWRQLGLKCLQVAPGDF